MELPEDVAAAAADIMAANGKPPGPIVPEVLPPLEDLADRRDDLSTARRFLATVGDDLVYCAEKKKWKIYREGWWQTDRAGHFYELAERFAAALYDEAATPAGYKYAERANNQAGFNAFRTLAREKKTVPIDVFDRKETTGHLLNCRNGMVDLETGALHPHDRNLMITRRVNVDYVYGAASELFDNFLRTIQPDPTVRAFLQRSIGYSLLGTVPERAFWILYGGGNNGKSVFTHLFNNVLGDYAATVTASAIMENPRASAIPNDIARLVGTRYIVVPETAENERLQSAVVKALSAGDRVSARFLFAEWFDFYFSGKLWIATNHKPNITDPSKGMWDRVKLVPFTYDVPDEYVDKSLLARLTADAGEAVLAWAVQGARDYFEVGGLDVPPAIQAEIDLYRYEQDSIAQFLAERCQTITQAEAAGIYVNRFDFQVDNPTLYAAYRKFCDDNGEYKYSQKRLSQNLRARGFVQGNSGGRYWEGIRLLGV